MNGASVGTKLIHESDAHCRGKYAAKATLYCLNVKASGFCHWMIYLDFDISSLRGVTHSLDTKMKVKFN